MKRMFVFSAVLVMLVTIAGCASAKKSGSAASGDLTLDKALQEAAASIDEQIEAGSKIALLNFNSPTNKFSDYVLDELTANLVDGRKLTVVDRKEIDLIREEFVFQYSGAVEDSSMQKLGRMLGAQSIVSGSLTEIGGGLYRIVIRVLNVQNASVVVQYRANIADDKLVKALLEGGESERAAAAASSSVRQTAQAPAEPAQAAVEPISAAPTRPTPLRNGIYNFFPRLRAMSGGIDVNSYIGKVVIRGGYFNVFIYGDPAREIKPEHGHGPNAGSWYAKVILQDLDNPRLVYEAEQTKDDDEIIVMFNKVPTGKRFSLTGQHWGDAASYVFEEFNMDNAEFE